MKLAIHQPNFLPWSGYFHKIAMVDTFVLLDDVQFERGKTFTSRTKIVISGVENWLTIPIIQKSDFIQIKDASVDPSFIWKKKHLRTLELNYRKTPYFDEVFELVATAYENSSEKLVDYNIPLIKSICNYLNIKTQLITSSSIQECTDLSAWDKLLKIITTLQADTYVSGSGAGSKRYVNQVQLSEHNITLEWQQYQHSEYKQFNSKQFIPNLSIIDMLFHKGKEAVEYLL
jgi:hypothetical protein